MWFHGAMVLHLVLAALASAPQLPALPSTVGPSEMVDPGGRDLVVELKEDEDVDRSNPLVVTAVSAVIVGGLLVWGSQAWWEDGLRPFSWRETGFFERDTYAGGADKMGHLFATYLLTHSATPMYESLGMNRSRAAWFASGATLLVANGIELVDGFTDFGFEYGDVLMNTLGVAVGLVTELYPVIDRAFGMRIGYVPSRDFLAHDKTVLKWINDYSGMLFYFDLKAKGVLELMDVDPGFARYLMTGVVFGSSQYSPIRRHELRRRTLGAYVGISLPELLREFGQGDEGVEAYADFFDYYAMPLLSVGIVKDLNGDDWFLNFGVANRVELGL